MNEQRPGIDRRTFLARSGAVVAGAAAYTTFGALPALAAPQELSGTISGTHTYTDGVIVPAGKTLTFDPAVNTTIRVSANFIVYGTLVMKPASAGVTHKLVFEDVDETAFQGGGNDPLDTDVGLWVVDDGKLDLQGTERVAWNRTGDDATWLAADELVVAPTAVGAYGTNGFKSFTKGAAVPVVTNPYGGPGASGAARFIDTTGSVHAADIDALAAAGITKGCNPPTNNRFCPGDNVTRGQMAAFLVRALNLPAAGSAGFVDTAGNTFEDDIDRLAAADITKGCNPPTNDRFCPNDFVTRGQMAAFLVRALNLPAAGSAGFVDTGGSVFEDDIDRLAAAGITKGCNPPTNDRYCPSDYVTRAQMASFLVRALDLPTAEAGTDWKAEVLNLTRNVQIEGTAQGRAHVFVRSSKVSTIKYAALRYMGPRDFSFFDEVQNTATGRYGIHFHMNGDASRGTVLEGVVVRDTGNHAFVPHLSHGITFRNCISYNTWENAYWWDPGADLNSTHDITWENCVAALVHADSASQTRFRLCGFDLQSGDRNVVRDSVAVGIQGATDASGVGWLEAAEGDWTVENIVCHNNVRHGFFVWQNIAGVHPVENFTLYHNGGRGIDHGAYVNAFDFDGGTLYKNAEGGILLHAVNNAGGEQGPVGDLTFQNLSIDGAGQVDHLINNARHTLPAAGPTKFRDCVLTGSTAEKVAVDRETDNPTLWDFIDCDLAASDILIVAGANADTRIRVQNGNSAFQVTPSGVTTISPFD